MATPPLPESPCLRVRLAYNEGEPGESGNRFFLSYSGTAPSPGDLTTLGTDIGSAWADSIAPIVNVDFTLMEVDVLDIATDSGASAEVAVSHVGSRSGSILSAQIATIVEYNIKRRYRGGKPRIFWPPPCLADLLDVGHWTAGFVTAANDATSAFFSTIEGLSVGPLGTLGHVNLSYYKGKNTATPPWRGPGYKYPPLYRDAALLDAVEGYSAKAMMGSQRRRRTSTTP